MTSAIRKIVVATAAIVGVVFASTTVEAHATPVTAPTTTLPTSTTTTTPVVPPKGGPTVTPMDWWWN
ncbi:hypothetical protein [Jatrophihabitans sp.]|uniref:hypothetical protein n=1 Tax=Jatrophihabitans sp. TaxID=1932789 RepID=UPI0030C69604